MSAPTPQPADPSGAGLAAAALGDRRPLTATERNWLLSLAIVVGLTLLAAAVRAVEISNGRVAGSERLVGNAVESAMRFLAMPHFLIAILFMSTSRAMQSARAWGWALGLTALGVGLCVLFGVAGGRAALVPNALFLSYFLVHEFRDQAFFYRVNGDVPESADPVRQRRDLLLVPALALVGILVVFLFGAAFGVGGTRRYTTAVYGGLGAPWRQVLGALFLLAWIGAIHATRRSWDRRHPGGALGFIRRNRPMFLVFGGILGVLVLDIVLNGRAYAIVTLHVASWYVFVMAGLARRPPPDPAPKAPGWRWIRSTRNGFNAFHGALFVGIVVLAIAWAYGFRNSADQRALWVLLSKDAFPYWTIMHVTISFTPR